MPETLHDRPEEIDCVSENYENSHNGETAYVEHSTNYENGQVSELKLLTDPEDFPEVENCNGKEFPNGQPVPECSGIRRSSREKFYSESSDEENTEIDHYSNWSKRIASASAVFNENESSELAPLQEEAQIYSSTKSRSFKDRIFKLTQKYLR